MQVFLSLRSELSAEKLCLHSQRFIAPECGQQVILPFYQDILTWTEKLHQPFRSALRDAELTGPTAAPGSEAASSFHPPCEARAARSGRADTWPHRLPGTG